MVNCHQDFLKRRALAFLESAKSDFKRGSYDLVLFHVEQFVHLYHKSIYYSMVICPQVI
ncbi:MAG: HEPN domain-containing protein [archaeon GB-1867-035]|nr:HEPN domain-containing protein [Candidatus Culexmicrobium profundum]